MKGYRINPDKEYTQKIIYAIILIITVDEVSK